MQATLCWQHLIFFLSRNILQTTTCWFQATFNRQHLRCCTQHLAGNISFIAGNDLSRVLGWGIPPMHVCARVHMHMCTCVRACARWRPVAPIEPIRPQQKSPRVLPPARLPARTHARTHARMHKNRYVSAECVPFDVWRVRLKLRAGGRVVRAGGGNRSIDSALTSYVRPYICRSGSESAFNGMLHGMLHVVDCMPMRMSIHMSVYISIQMSMHMATHMPARVTTWSSSPTWQPAV